MSLYYHDYLRDVAVRTDRATTCKPSQPMVACRPLTPCFEDLAVPSWKKHMDGDFEAYLRHALRHLSGERHQNDFKHRDHEIHELAKQDIIAASIKICMLETERSADLRFARTAERDALITLLITCADGDMVEVKALNTILEALSGVSALTTPLLLQILVAVAFRHDNNKLVCELVTWSAPPRRNLFDLKPRSEGQETGSCRTWLWSHWLHSTETPAGARPLDGWAALLRANWVKPCGDMMQFVYRAHDDDEAAHAIYIFNRVLRSKEGLPTSCLKTIEHTVAMGAPAVVAHMLAKLPYRHIWPRPHYLLTDAARRTTRGRGGGGRWAPLGPEMLEALRPMRLDVNSIVDPRGKAKGVSPREQTPLHAATAAGNVRTTRWCLRNGARPTKDWAGRYQWEKVRENNNSSSSNNNNEREEMLALYRAEGWEIDSKTWLLEWEIRRGGSFLGGFQRLFQKIST